MFWHFQNMVDCIMNTCMVIKKGCRLSESTTNIALCSMKFYKVSKQLPKL